MGKHIPQKGTLEEEAEFWRTTPIEDLAPGQLEPVEVARPERSLSATFAIRLDPNTVEEIRRIARADGLGATQLVRRWVLDRLRLEEVAGGLASTTSGLSGELELQIRRDVVDALTRRLASIAEEAVQGVLDQADQEAQALHDAVDA